MRSVHSQPLVNDPTQDDGTQERTGPVINMAPNNTQLMDIMVRALNILAIQRRGDRQQAGPPINRTMAPSTFATAPTASLYAMPTQIPPSNFLGSRDMFAPYDYIQEFKRFARAQTGVHIDFVLQQYMPFSLKGDALRWWEFRCGYTSWNMFRHDFLYQFGRPRFKENIKRTIENRKQGQNEAQSTFILEIDSLYEKLGECTPEYVKVSTVLYNMNPESRRYMHLRRYRDLREMQEDALSVQELMRQDRIYAMPRYSNRYIYFADTLYPTQYGKSEQTMKSPARDRVCI
jgi:hypothetical protein